MIGGYMYKQIEIDYNYLIPYISPDNLYYHYLIYLTNLKVLNDLLLKEKYDYRYSKTDLIKHIDIFNLNIRGEILYYLSSVVNHELFFKNLSNNYNNIPEGNLLEDINKSFGSYDNFKRLFKNSALNLKGSGYTYLVKDNQNNLKIMNTSNEDNPIYYGYIPVFNIDLWEHAYYLDYKNKSDYIDNFFHLIDYKKISLDYT